MQSWTRVRPYLCEFVAVQLIHDCCSCPVRMQCVHALPAVSQTCRMLKPVATCGLPNLANANYMRGAHWSSKKRRYRHNPNLLEALRIIRPSRDYTHVYEFTATGSLIPLPVKSTATSQDTRSQSEQKVSVENTNQHASQEQPPPPHTAIPPHVPEAPPTTSQQILVTQVLEGMPGSHAQGVPQVQPPECLCRN